METVSEKKYETVKNFARQEYYAFAPVPCPALKNELVYFTAEGFSHLIFKNKNRERGKKDQFARFHFLSMARDIIATTTTVQEVEEHFQEVTIKIKKRKEKTLKKVTWWAFIAVIKNLKLKVIVKKTGNGKIIFWSVIPFWKTSKRDGIFIRTFSVGSLKED